ncbi:hypothetical protein PV04_05292 [Phialophora macrospora]|uniref:Heterokaryon incompatibility domain-containing protein n=1 Tax=Phialophora macrospora TaxID=1851006 RepID=A0A0D2FMM4_9EURO|nr:hypothetical protein PV04_05292 [Phialophora macrospora]
MVTSESSKRTSMMEEPEEIRVIPNDYQHYKPLDRSKKHTRLLRIEPAECSRDPLVCHLYWADLDHAPAYTALSYAWGSLDDTLEIRIVFHEGTYARSSCAIQLNENPHGRDEPDLEVEDRVETGIVSSFRITRNLHAGLRCLRMHEDASALIWADMLCLNQSNAVERSHQVGFMDEVFSGATKVVVWLGGDPEVPSDVLPEHDRSLGTLSDLLEKVGLRHLPVPGAGDIEAIAHEIALQRRCGSPFESIIALAKDCWPCDGRLRQRRLSTFAVDFYIAILFAKMLEAGPVGLGSLSRLLDPTSYVWQLYRVVIIDAAERYDKGNVLEALAPEIEVAYTDCIPFLGRLRQLLSMPWFGRLWVVQEVAGKDDVSVRHGGSMLAWRSISLCCQIYCLMAKHNIGRPTGGKFRRELLDFVAGVQPAAFWGTITSQRLPICQLLLSSCSLKTTVPRDRLYAVYRLASDSSKMSFEPDYGESLQGTYTGFTRALIEATRRLDIFSMLPETSAHAAPSWVPQYHRLSPDNAHQLFSGDYPSDGRFRASGDRPACCIRAARAGSLILQGVHLATVRCGVASIAPRSFNDTWNSLVCAHNGLFGPKLTTEDTRRDERRFSVEEFMGAVLSFVVISPFLNEDASFMMLKRLTSIFMSVMWLLHSTNVQLSHLSVEDIWALRRRDLPPGAESELLMRGELLSLRSQQFRYFFTSDGSLGCCRQLVQEGDLVVALDGGSFPFVLRQRLPSPHDRGRAEAMKGGVEFQLVGTCYLHRLMEGKLFEDPRWRESDPLYADPMDYDPDFRTPGGAGYTKGFYRKRPFVIT